MFQFLILLLFFLLFSETPAKDEVKQFPSLIMAQEGDTINITCNTTGQSLGLYLKRSTIEFKNVMYLSKEGELIMDTNYENRTFFSGILNNLVITITDIGLNDTDVYTCQATVFDNLKGTGTMVVVTEKIWKKEDGNLRKSQMWVVLIVISFFFGLALWPLFVIIKKQVYSSKTQNTCSIYEEMSYNAQRNVTCQDN
ncbi:T-cell antigen CD7 [Antechinus flavipes]|uniref:T-cell antigen CD7 n=1 Tax=Antechinus flavipes TaxID=38775 RepID=UPI0022357310|nr:T-cell antigen CD7 [Antechinus flavipes]